LIKYVGKHQINHICSYIRKNLKPNIMGRGDMKTKKGKRTAGSYGNTRPRKKTKSAVAPKAAKAPKVAKAKAPAKKAAKKKED
jgi:30S ribosomal protein S31